MVIAGTNTIDWDFAAQVSGYGFAAVFAAMSILAAAIWIIGKCHTSFEEKLKGKGHLVASFILMILTILLMAHIMSEKQKEIKIHLPVQKTGQK